jgi:hypothetical protein
MPVIPALGRLRQEDQEFKASLGYIPKTMSQKTTDRQKESLEQCLTHCNAEK